MLKEILIDISPLRSFDLGYFTLACTLVYEYSHLAYENLIMKFDELEICLISVLTQMGKVNLS